MRSYYVIKLILVISRSHTVIESYNGFGIYLTSLPYTVCGIVTDAAVCQNYKLLGNNNRNASH